MGCGSSTKSASGGEGGPKMASDLLGVYKVDRYQSSQGGCDQLIDAPETPEYLVLYGFQPSDGSEKARLGGTFCGSPDLCRALAERALEPTIGYSFISGDDASAWQGWAISGIRRVEDQCGATVQSHVLNSVANQKIRIETSTVETVFQPIVEEEVATCSNKNAIAAVTDELPCEALLVLEATREGGL